MRGGPSGYDGLRQGVHSRDERSACCCRRAGEFCPLNVCACVHVCVWYRERMWILLCYRKKATSDDVVRAMRMVVVADVVIVVMVRDVVVLVQGSQKECDSRVVVTRVAYKREAFADDVSKLCEPYLSRVLAFVRHPTCFDVEYAYVRHRVVVKHVVQLQVKFFLTHFASFSVLKQQTKQQMMKRMTTTRRQEDMAKMLEVEYHRVGRIDKKNEMTTTWLVRWRWDFVLRRWVGF